jgi:hypothetical protein
MLDKTSLAQLIAAIKQHAPDKGLWCQLKPDGSLLAANAEYSILVYDRPDLEMVEIDARLNGEHIRDYEEYPTIEGAIRDLFTREA